jgi:hypothetical protein
MIGLSQQTKEGEIAKGTDLDIGVGDVGGVSLLRL